MNTPASDNLKYQRPAELTKAAAGDEVLTLSLRFKQPDGRQSEQALVVPVRDSAVAFDRASGDFRFAAAVAGFGMLLRDSQFRGNVTFGAVREIAEQALDRDPHGRRAEFLQLLRQASVLDTKRIRHKTEALRDLGDEGRP